MILLPNCTCCGCSEECCRTVTYGYYDTEPPGKWYDECPNVGNCLTGSAAVEGDCAGDVIEGYIVERFCKQSIEGKEIHAYLRQNSAIDDFGTIAGIDTDEECGRLGRITADHDITAELEFEDDGAYLLAKVPFLAENSQVGGPLGAAGVVICWCCVDPYDPPPEGEICPCCDVPPPPPPPLKYDCVDGECAEVGEGGAYDDPTCGGECQECETNADCGCVDGGYTYYAGMDALFPGQGCCPPGTVFEPSLSACSSDGTALGVAASGESLRCCGGECVNVVVLAQGGCSEGDGECPEGCCPEPTYVCCPDGFNCAPCIQDCENLFP